MKWSQMNLNSNKEVVRIIEKYIYEKASKDTKHHPVLKLILRPVILKDLNKISDIAY